MSKRGFEVISSYADKNIQLPKRATKHAAGYDFEAAEEIVLPAIWKTIVNVKKVRGCSLENCSGATTMRRSKRRSFCVRKAFGAYRNQSLHAGR